MKSDNDPEVSQRINQILHPHRPSPEPAASIWDGVEAAGEAWPPGWPEDRVAPPPGPGVSGAVRDRLTAGGRALTAGPRWDVPVRAAMAAAVLALFAVGLSFVVVRPGSAPAAGLAVPESTSAKGLSGPAAAVTAADVAGAGPPVASVAVIDSPTASGSAGAGVPAADQSQVYVVGQVNRPGVVSLAADARVQDAIEAAGGATDKADLTEMNLARKIVDGERILVPKPGQAVPAPDPAAPAAPADGTDGVAAGGSAAGPTAPVDLNTATATELDALPGVGPVLAGRIVAWRQANGGFKQVDDLAEVQGIGDATLAKLRPMVRV
jgi:competence protein ComEA